MAIDHVGVIGAGTSGNCVAVLSALAGLKVTLIDSNAAFLERSFQNCKIKLDYLVKTRVLSEQERLNVAARIRPTVHLSALGDTNIVIETEIERLVTKEKLLRIIDAIVPPETIIVYEASLMSVTQAGSAFIRSDKFIGVKLVAMPPGIEVVHTLDTSEVTNRKLKEFLALLEQNSLHIEAFKVGEVYEVTRHS